MSNSKEITSWETKMKEMAAQQATQETTGSNYISLKGGMMTYMNQPMPNNEMEVVILGATGEHSYYDESYDPDRIIPPKCFAVFDLNDEAVSHDDIPEEQKQDGGEGCKICWAHKFKSADNGRGRACAVRRRIAVIPAVNVDSPEDADVAIMKLPPTSVTNWSKYVNKLSAQYQRPFFMVTTRIFVTPHPKFQYTVNFETKQLVDNENFEKLVDMHTGTAPILLAPLNMTGAEEPKLDSVKQKATRNRK
jgi:hypothetical protein